MSEHHLPDDVSNWPRDPYELLGVVRGATAREIKRAYTQLIRIYKPEHAPEAFRLIREAYESASRMAEYFAAIPTPEPAPEAEPAPTDDSLRPVIKSEDDEIDECWTRALNGDDRSAYEGLRGLVERYPQRSDLYARLYWLCFLNPELDPLRTRTDWLQRGLSACRLDVRLAELFHREGKRDNIDILAERGRTLLATEAPTYALANFLTHRWELLLQAHQYQAIHADVLQVAERLRHDDTAAWLRLMVQLADWLHWISNKPADDLYAVVRDELRLLEGVALQQSHWFDRLDQLKFLVKQVNQMEDHVVETEQLADVIRRSWSQPFEEVVPVLERLLYVFTTHPTVWLSRLYRVAVHSSAVLDYLTHLLDQYEGYRDAYPAPSKELWSEAADHVIWGKLSGHQLRTEVFQFCFERNIDPMMVLSSYMEVSINEYQGSNLPTWLQSFIGDQTLVLLLRACRLFRQ